MMCLVVACKGVITRTIAGGMSGITADTKQVGFGMRNLELYLPLAMATQIELRKGTTMTRQENREQRRQRRRTNKPNHTTKDEYQPKPKRSIWYMNRVSTARRLGIEI